MKADYSIPVIYSHKSIIFTVTLFYFILFFFLFGNYYYYKRIKSLLKGQSHKMLLVFLLYTDFFNLKTYEE